MIRLRSCLLPLLLLTLAAPRLWAWGCSGHEVVALIALHDLQTLDAKNHTHVAQQVETLLAAQTHGYQSRYCSDLGLDPIAYFATWADDYRGQNPTSGPWHFWDIPLSVNAGQATQYCDTGCVVQQLPLEVAILADKTKDAATRSQALLFVIHFVGDEHQPLHATDNNDRGGNCVPVTFLNKKPSGNAATGSYSPNLHGVWDTQIPEHLGGITRNSAQAKQELQTFVASLIKGHAAVNKAALAEPVDFTGWANQAHTVAQADPYAKLQPAIAPLSPMPVTSCTENNTAANYLALNETIDDKYLAAVGPDVEVQLTRAGARLANVLYTTLR